MGLGEELRAMALLRVGTTEFWTGRFEEAERHLEHARTLAQQIGRPYLEFASLVHWARAEMARSFALVLEPSRQAIELARRHGRRPLPVTPTWRWAPPWSGGDGSRRRNPGFSAPSARCERKPSPPPRLGCTTFARSSSSRGAGRRTRSPPSAPESGRRSGSWHRTARRAASRIATANPGPDGCDSAGRASPRRTRCE